MTEAMEFIKHSGSGWLKNALKREGVSCSKLGQRVANVLGQVFLGIYHINDSVLRQPLVWGQAESIGIKLHNELASYDGRGLSMLAFCCKAAGLEFSIQPSSYRYVQITFTWARERLVAWPKEPEGDLMNLTSDSLFLIKNKVEKTPYFIRYSLSGLNWTDVLLLLSLAHSSCVRVAIRRRSNSTIELMSSPRDSREGDCWERHPTLEGHIKTMSPYIHIDYQSDV